MIPDIIDVLAGSSSRMRALQSLNTKLACLQIEDAGYDDMVEGVRRVVGCDACALLLVDRQTTNLVVQSAVGYAELPVGTQIPIAADSHVQCQAHCEEYAVHVPAASEVPGIELLDPDMQSNLVVPLRIKDQCVGVFDFASRQQRAFSDDDIDLAGMLVDQMVFLLENQRLMRELAGSRDALIRGMALLAESREHGIAVHLDRISSLVRMLTRRLPEHPEFRDQVDEDFVDVVARAAALHDVGKVGIPDSILLKPGRLTPDEFEIMKRHARIGYDLLYHLIDSHGSCGVLRMGADVAWAHHENWDGSGYPRGLSGEQIPLAARIVALADMSTMP